MPISSKKIREIESTEDTGLSCKIVERTREIHEFEKFVSVGIDKETGDLVITKQSGRELDVVALIELMKAYIKQFEDYYKENYNYPQELPLKEVIKEIYGAAKEKDLLHDTGGE